VCRLNAPSPTEGRSYMCWRSSEIALLILGRAEVGLTDTGSKAEQYFH
jgi:hypothetical protein